VETQGSARHDRISVGSWQVEGGASVVGDVDAGSVQGSGLVSVGGTWRSGTVRLAGMLEVYGPTEIRGPFTLTGSARFHAPVTLADATVGGAVEVNGPLTATGPVRFTGTTQVHGPFTAPSLHFQGILRVDGDLQVPKVTGVLAGGKSKIARILANDVELTRVGGLFSFPPWKTAGSLEVLRIEAHYVSLEGVRAEYVRADEIRLGAGCQIQHLDGQVLEQHRTARVGYVSETPPPPGMTR
jgi:cytoskeletal protein CcmA (bactofilin family)